MRIKLMVAGGVAAALLATPGLSSAAPMQSSRASDLVITPVSEKWHTAEQIRAQQLEPDNAALTLADREAHQAAQAAEGRLVDMKKIFAVALDQSRVVWEVGSSVDSFREWTISADDPATEGTDVEVDEGGLEMAEYEYDSDDLPVGTEGIGLGGYTSPTGSGRLLANYCQTWKSQGHTVHSCSEKFKPTNDFSSTRDYYAYNRWGFGAGKQVLGADFKPTIIDFRSRPRKGYETRTKGLSDYFPRTATELCSEGASATMAVGGLGFTIPLSNCEDKTPKVDATLKSMGIRFDQGVVFGGSHFRAVDFEMEVFSFQGGAQPLLGDYNYGKFCRGTVANCHAVIGHDGW